MRAISGIPTDRTAHDRGRAVFTRPLDWGASFAELYLEDRETQTVWQEEGRVGRVLAGRERGAAIRVECATRSSLAFTESLDLESLLVTAEAGRAARGSRAVDGAAWAARQGFYQPAED